MPDFSTGGAGFKPRRYAAPRHIFQQENHELENEIRRNSRDSP
jgi:hypothetical protein